MSYFADTESLVTVRDWLRFAVSRFNEAKLHFGHGSDNAFDEAAYLILATLHLPVDRLEPFLDASLTHGEAEDVLRVLERRVRERVPAAYLTREAWLAGHSFYVDERVIVPRSFIAELLADQLAPWVEAPDSVPAVLDLCTGSGCLAILAALAFPHAHVDAADLSRDALDVAKRNVADYGLGERIDPVESDLFAALTDRAYDLIVSNPPYVDAESVAALPAEYRAEPALALGSGTDGLDATRRILAGARAHLKPGGLLVVEIGHNRAALEAAFPALPFVWLDTVGGDGHVFLLRREDLA
ncbi:MAG: ribosomal protein L3 N(5)-glutamine methyltransferase [Thiobacillus sp. SCN 64-35]|jgi:ribosomal protein L3 glutamine methyltransferase|nr:50S ribosomal protein L3 N(5)-glutamine methyltransferase [Betaproteobacteria bacterium SCN1]MBN8759805.1 50S ribosomal protein L3 N(5)-glutamine methyltransferase [Thiobacillus sp.]ODU12100.1 MAG: ribosomal protein L3 N(5)-glutamine methyltransferase [Thiobacillus sp. SCN 64-35]ODU89509.1 MAG: ribosomal protein L3 N(5)-glutamine methyltransferase [Thiobacillus sp. SCN 65-179]OJW37438.1 MAG: ribosomal protein L3 N(5)-glutamine methyltransferase [Thiobacillus sp. 65-69]